MSSPPAKSGSCSCCPYPGSLSQPCQEAGHAQDIGNMGDAGVGASPEENLLRMQDQLFDSESRQHTVANNWDSATTNAPLETAEAVPEEHYRIQALAQGALGFSLTDRPLKRNRAAFEGASPKPCPETGSQSTTCSAAFRKALAQVIRRHIGSSRVNIECTVGGDWGDAGERYRIEMAFQC